MPIKTSLAELETKTIIYVSKDPLDINCHLFSFDFPIADYDGFYIITTYNKLVYFNSWSYANESTIRLKLDNGSDRFYSTKSTKHQVILTKGIETNYDFIDKYGQSGTVYVYRTFSIENISNTTYQTNINILSIDLSLALYTNYPLVYNKIKYTNGVPYPSITIPAGSYNTSKLIGIFNSEYKGTIATNGTIANFTSIDGELEVALSGIVEFSTSSSGPWSSVLVIPSLAPNNSVTVYSRCGKDPTVLFKSINSIKVFSTETV